MSSSALSKYPKRTVTEVEIKLYETTPKCVGINGYPLFTLEHWITICSLLNRPFRFGYCLAGAWCGPVTSRGRPVYPGTMTMMITPWLFAIFDTDMTHGESLTRFREDKRNFVNALPPSIEQLLEPDEDTTEDLLEQRVDAMRAEYNLGGYEMDTKEDSLTHLMPEPRFQPTIARKTYYKHRCRNNSCISPTCTIEVFLNPNFKPMKITRDQIITFNKWVSAIGGQKGKGPDELIFPESTYRHLLEQFKTMLPQAMDPNTPEQANDHSECTKFSWMGPRQYGPCIQLPPGDKTAKWYDVIWLMKGIERELPCRLDYEAPYQLQRKSKCSCRINAMDIKGLDKVKLLRALWGNSKPDPLFSVSESYFELDKFDEKRANDVIDEGMINYFCGKPISVDLSKSILRKDPSKDYDDHAVKPAKEIIDLMRGHFVCDNRDHPGCGYPVCANPGCYREVAGLDINPNYYEAIGIRRTYEDKIFKAMASEDLAFPSLAQVQNSDSFKVQQLELAVEAAEKKSAKKSETKLKSGLKSSDCLPPFQAKLKDEIDKGLGGAESWWECTKNLWVGEFDETLSQPSVFKGKVYVRNLVFASVFAQQDLKVSHKQLAKRTGASCGYIRCVGYACTLLKPAIKYDKLPQASPEMRKSLINWLQSRYCHQPRIHEPTLLHKFLTYAGTNWVPGICTTNTYQGSIAHTRHAIMRSFRPPGKKNAKKPATWIYVVPWLCGRLVRYKSGEELPPQYMMPKCEFVECVNPFCYRLI